MRSCVIFIFMEKAGLRGVGGEKEKQKKQYHPILTPSPHDAGV